VTWNYRVIEFQTGDETHRAIHEVYYDDAGKPNGYTANPASIWWYADEAVNVVLNRSLTNHRIGGQNWPFNNREDVGHEWRRDSPTAGYQSNPGGEFPTANGVSNWMGSPGPIAESLGRLTS
jgi:hypothetical protein